MHFFGKVAEGITAKKAKEDVANDDGPEGTFVIFGDGNAPSSIEEGYDLWGNLARGNQVENSGEVFGESVRFEEPSAKGLVRGARKAARGGWVGAANDAD